ncbi:CcdB family protein [Ramlibacter sp. AW1]|uniref:Toxin CcdB n=1 Tax=Ramlibacter aurantiacus TaxID=2801330 RepID=A0A937D1X7_9BURK|nr:CcdB family protein [Ramlibacter aurantiacus]MBL0420994.1 CcdB family protein [Ramlibacter aurantiacus]
MAQFDVFENPNRSTRDLVPYVLDVQSALIEQLATRLVMPLSRVGSGVTHLPGNLCPMVEVRGERLVLMPHLAAPIPLRLLREPVAGFSHLASDICAAMDAVLSGY